MRRPDPRRALSPAPGKGLRAEFWRRYPLEDLTRAEWEALCDGCAKCCLIKLEDEDTGEVAYTSVACRLLDLGTCRCGNYPLRRQLVRGCVVLGRDNLEEVLAWMPRSCAYRRVNEGRGLADWHPLVSGDPESVHAAGVSIRGQTISEETLEDPEEAIQYAAWDLLEERGEE